jgi:hypothetical protein
MSEGKQCVRCERAIDAWARLCPYCNWDQSKPAPVHEVVPAPVAEYKPPEERSVRKAMIYGGIGAVVLVLAFVIGMFINRDAPKNVPEPVIADSQAEVSAPKRADMPLVPVNEPGGIEQPITSAPASGPVPGAPSTEWDRSDATAVSSVEYAQLAKRAQAERKKVNAFADPRSLTGPAYAQEGRPHPVARRAVAATAAASVTRPIPLSRPLPRVNAVGTARLDLIIGPDGRVKDINIRQAIGGHTGALVGAVQSWRFKPATANGAPVSAPYSVAIQFRQR